MHLIIVFCGLCMLCRSPKFKITASAALSGSILSAYEDVTADDPDFESIQGNSQSFFGYMAIWLVVLK